MKRFSVAAFLVLFSIAFVFSAWGEVMVGEKYDVLSSTDLRTGPGINFGKKINKKATVALGKEMFLAIDDSTTIKVVKIEKDWAEIQVEEPEYLRESHIGWVPINTIKSGTSTKKIDGWMKTNCLVFRGKNENKPIGTLTQKASVQVADDESGWLRIIFAPIRTISKEKFLSTEEIGNDAYIESKEFTQVIPGKW